MPPKSRSSTPPPGPSEFPDSKSARTKKLLGEILLNTRKKSYSMHSYLQLMRLAGASLLGAVMTLACCGYAAAQQTIWPSTALPATIDNGASGPLELGVSFKSDVNGTITGVRFYKSALNTGTHVGHLWSSTGTLLASVSFTGETASGWQQANFSSPVAVTANTTYVASYSTTVGHFSADWSYFATTGFNNVPLHALQTPNGVYGTSGAYPAATHDAANYWVDVVFKGASAPAASAAYGFSEGSGTTTADSSGSGNTGTLAAATWTTAGRYGNALTFNGTTTDVEAANSSALNPGTTATFSAWVKVTAANSDISSVLNKWSQTADDEYLFGLDSANHLTFAWQTTGGNSWGLPSYNLVSGTSQVPLNTWTYVTAVRNGTAISFYINGNLDATFPAAADTNPFRGGINSLRIGGQNRGGIARVLNGTIDEVRLYQKALTQAQIQSEMNTPIKAATMVAPAVTTQPASQSVAAGATATFAVAVTGTAPLQYQWHKNGTAISGATSASYTTPATTASDSGSQFNVVASNSAGSATSNTATLNVSATLVAPAIITQPASKTVTVGQTATFQVAASGSTPLVFEWRKNGTAISGATAASYTTPAATTADNGAQYTVLVSNSAGSATSGAATLTVNAATLALSATPTTLSFGNVDTSTINTLPVVLKNTGTGNVTVSSVTASGAGFSSSNVSAGSILAPGQSATMNVTFAPSATGSVTGSVVVASNATNSPSTISVSGAGVHSNFSTWVAPSLVRVGKTDAAGTLSSMSLSGARGETVDSQVVVQGPAGGLTNVNVSATALTGPNGASIAASNITLYREYYLAVTGTASYGGGSNPPQGSGTYPEPLIPFVDPETGAALCSSSASLKACNASISPGQNQPYWIDISIPHGSTVTPPGTYTGSISVTSSQGSATVPVTVTVWNFELPTQPSEATLWTLWSPNAGNTTTTLARALMRNKVMGWYDPAANAPADVTNMGLNRSGLDSYYYIGIQCNGAYSSIPSTSQIDSAAANFPSGLALDFYMADELNGCTGDYSPIKTLAANAHAANRSVKTMMTINAVDPNLYGSVDHWVLLNSVQQWPALPFTGGGDLWSYTSCNAGYGNAPEWMTDYPPINERIQAGFLNFTQGATGLLYYRADGWTAGNAIGSWNNVDTTACGGGLGRPGDGIFLYPPAPIASTESAPGIRLKAIRDGIQDYEYAQLLKSQGQDSFLAMVLKPVATSWSDWNHNPDVLETARQKLGKQLHQLSQP